MKNLITAIALVVILAGCAFLYLHFTKKPEQSTPSASEKTTSEGYKRYVSACIADGESEYTCRCQGGLLANVLPEEKLVVLADAGEAMSKNDTAKIDEIKKNSPEVFKALEDLADEAAKCVLE